MKALILAGGESSRMKTDKSTIIYREKPIREELYNMLVPFVDDVYISCNSQQINSIPSIYNILIDNPTYFNCGPMTALLSAIDAFPNNDWLVLGCDYPLISKKNIELLFSQRNTDLYATVYCHTQSQIIEPLIGIYEEKINTYILQAFKENQLSLRRILEKLPIHKIRSEEVFLQSIDTQEMMLKTKNKIK